MRITTWNVNGLRAALRKGFAKHLDSIRPDVLLLQEVRAMPEQLPAEWREPDGWHAVWNPAQKKGYAGTAIWSRQPIQTHTLGLNRSDKDEEGRLITTTVQGVGVASVYLPSGSSGDHRQAEKEQWMKRFKPWADEQRKATTPFIFGGDLNIAHTERDIFHAKSNQKTSGFLPHERDWMTKVLDSGWRDLVREDYDQLLTAGGDASEHIRERFGVEGEGIEPDRHGPYSWWSNRGSARAKNRGWRIDYLLANPAAAERFVAAHVHRAGGMDTSDHAPVSIDLED
ncbi:MAG: exodeoxyribonuclease III [Phycisphaeraceae bacterium]